MKINLLNKILLIFTIMLSAMFISGCKNRRETNTLAIAGAMAFDFENDKQKITFEIIKPKQAGKLGEENNKPVIYVQASGDSVFEIMRDTTTKFDRKIFTPDIRVYIVSEEVARKGLAEFFDYLTRDHETRLGIPILIAKGSTAAEVLGSSPGIADIPSDYIRNMNLLSKFNGKSQNLYLKDFLKNYYEEGIESIVGIIEKKKDVGNVKKGEFELSDEGSAVFIEDKLVGFLNGKETRAVNFVIGKVESGSVTSPSKENGFNSVEIINAKSKNNVNLNDGSAEITVNIDLNIAMLSEIVSKKEMDYQKIKEIEDETSKVITSEVSNTINKIQKDFKSDVFGFGKIVHRKYPREWKEIKSNWNETFSRADVKVNVTTTIRRHGLTDVPLKNKEAK